MTPETPMIVLEGGRSQPMATARARAHLRRRDLLLRFGQCLGLSAILLAMNYGDLLGGGADVRMHVPYRLTGIVAAQVADIFLLAAVFFLLLLPMRRTRLYPFVRLLLAILLPIYILYRLQDLMPWVTQNGLLVYLDIAWAMLLLLLYFKTNAWYRRLMRLGNALSIFLLVFALSSIAQLLWVVRWRPGPRQVVAAWERTPGPPRDHPKLVWIVFDELSYDQVFEHRAHDLALPHFNQLRAVSTTFTDVQPIGLKTVKIVPSLLSGSTIDDIRFNFDNTFKVHDEGVRGWHTLNGANTLFGDAQRAGWRTAAVGWYNPYCSVYGDAIADCYFMNLDRIDGLMSQKDSFWRNTWSPLQQMVREFKAPARAGRDICTYDVRQRLKTHLDLHQHMLEVLNNDRSDMVFLHLGIPHSPNIWSRAEDNYTPFCDSSYLDNLALTDRVLGEVMATLQASPRWKDTTLIVQGDHSWRIFLWDWLPAWTDEDDASSRNGFDPRPALLIHQPGQTTPMTVATQWPLIRLHAVVEQVLHGQPLVF